MNILITKEELEFLLLCVDNTDKRKRKKTKDMFRKFRENKNDYIIINVEKENIFDLYNTVKDFQENCLMDDIRLFKLEDKLLRFINDIKMNKYDWNNKDKKEDLETEGVIDGFSSPVEI